MWFTLGALSVICKNMSVQDTFQDGSKFETLFKMVNDEIDQSGPAVFLSNVCGRDCDIGRPSAQCAMESVSEGSTEPWKVGRY